MLRIPIAILSASLLARTVGPEGVGQWAMVLAVTTLLYSVLLGWTQAPNVRFGREEWTAHRKLSDTWAARWPIVGFGLLIATILLVTQPFLFLESTFDLNATFWPLILVFVLGQWWLAESQSLFRITDKISRFAVIPIVIDLVTIVFLAVLLFYPTEIPVTTVIIGMVVILTIISGGAWFIELRSTYSFGGRGSFQKRLKIIKYGWPLIPGLLLSHLSNWGDHIILQHFQSVGEVGLFSASYQVLVALTGLTASVPLLLLPKLIDEKLADPEIEHDYIKRIGPTVASLWLIIIIPLLVFIPWLFLIVFGEKFYSAMPILLMLCVAVPCSIFTSFYAILFELQGRLGRSSLFTGIILGVNVVISLALVVEYGGIGTALGTVVSYFIAQVLYIFDQHKLLNVSISKITILLAFSIIYGVAQFAMGEDIITRAGGALMGMLCLIGLIRHYNMADKAILTRLFSGKLLSLNSFFCRLLIQDKVKQD